MSLHGSDSDVLVKRPVCDEDQQCADTHGRPEARRWGSVFPGLTGAVPHHLAVDGAADTVVQLDVEFGQNVGCKVEQILR